MAMQKHMNFLILVYALLSVLSNSKFGCGSIVGDYRNRSCVESEKQALLLLKESLVDDRSYLSSWNGDDCCAWHGVGCNNRTGHVIQLDLGNGLLKGEHLYPSLLDLKYLTYLDLSNNSFSHMKIPQFLGSFKDLTYLNLSYSCFEGLVPHHLGNLSKLRYLDLSNNYNYYYNLLSIDSMRWLSGLSTLKHLGLSNVNLSRATDWFSSINMLSNSISVLQLSSCSLSNNIPRHLPLINLTSLVSLDLGGNQLNSDFPSWVLNNTGLAHLYLGGNQFNGSIPESIGRLKLLSSLDVSYNRFEGLVPHHLGNLSKLRYLDLSYNYYYNYNYSNNYDDNFKILLSIDSMRWLSGLSTLKHLGLSYVNLSRATDWFSSINMLSNSVSELELYSCSLSNNIPRHFPLINLTSLVSLDLRDNQLNSDFPSWVLNNTGLANLYLGGNQFNGSIPDSIGTLTSLLELHLSGNNFNGLIPESIGRLKSLSSLSVSNNEFQGPLPESMGSLTSLTRLYLRGNRFEGLIPNWIGNLTSLTGLSLGGNRFEGLIPNWIGNLTSLTGLSLSGLDLSDGKFEGPIPESIGYLTSLTFLGFAFNKLSGSIPNEIGNLTELTYLSMQSNQLTGRLPEGFCQMSKLESLYVNKNQLSGSIPECVGELSNLIEFSLESNSWEGFITEHHFVNLTKLTYFTISSKSNLVLNVSFNWTPPFQLQSIYMDSLKVGPKFPSWLLTQRQITAIMMKNTSISDTIPADWFASLLSQPQRFSSGLNTFAVSNNRFSGEFPSFLCNATSLETLIISNNNFSGELPRCLGNLTHLRYFDVMNNNFSGDIPVSLGSLLNLTYLNLNNNKFQGKLPISFQNLKELVTLDVGKNNLIDNLPPWSGEQFPQLKYLILRSNNFFGEIPTQLCHYSSIQILNLAQNKIRGSIPPCFGNLSAMITGNNSDLFPGFQTYYGEMIIDDMKGYELEYTTTLGFSYSIDLSNNNISGEIPEELMDLRGLVNLDLAGNHLTGRIPKRIGKVEKLEFLDLSRNKLYGSIPQSLSDLHFLSQLNLSFNNLSGRIPTGYQLQTLEDPSIYAGNNQLCGQPILKPCDGDIESRNIPDYDEGNSDSGDERVWFYAGIGPGLLCGFLGFCASLHFIKSWRYSYFHFVELVFDKIAVAVALLLRKFRN